MATHTCLRDQNAACQACEDRRIATETLLPGSPYAPNLRGEAPEPMSPCICGHTAKRARTIQRHADACPIRRAWLAAYWAAHEAGDDPNGAAYRAAEDARRIGKSKRCTYENTLTWDLLCVHEPQGRVLNAWEELLALHPELDGARISESDKIPRLGLMMSVELERTMGPGGRRDLTVRRIGAAHDAEIRVSESGVADHDWVTTSAIFRFRDVLIGLETKLCACHAEHVED